MAEREERISAICKFCGRGRTRIIRSWPIDPNDRKKGSNYKIVCTVCGRIETLTDSAYYTRAAKQVKRVEEKAWKEKVTPTDILCPRCTGAHLVTDGEEFWCPHCKKHFASQKEVEKRAEKPPIKGALSAGQRRAEYEKERVSIRDKHGGKWYKWGIRPKYYREAAKEKRKHLGIPESMKTSEALKTNITTANVLTALVFIGAGFVLAAALGNMYFMLAMLSVGMFTLFPAPPEYNGPPASWGSMNPVTAGFWHSSHHGLAFLRSISKISAIIFFALAFRDVGGVFNIPFMLTCFIGYFSLKITYNPKVPGELLESLLRFGFLGAYFIPLVVFSSIFQSYVLIIIAFAFFAIPPIPVGKKGNEALVVQGDVFLKGIFFVLMFIALIGSGALASIGFQPDMFGAGWALEGAMAYTFLYFWVISFIGGMFTPSESRPVIGFIMILGATVIWGMGPGSQEVGSALLGQWWPTVHNAFTSISEPLTDVFGALGNTFGSAFLMITNPVAYAHQVMEGNYGQTSGTEKIGPIGIKILDFRIGTGANDIYVEQPFQFMFTLKNEGGFEAKNVKATIYTDFTYNIMKDIDLPKLPKEAEISIKTGTKKVHIGELFGVSKAELKKLPNNENLERIDCERSPSSGVNCDNYIFYLDDKGENNLEQQDMRSFMMGGVLGCGIVKKADLRNKFIPINVKVSYDYEVESSFQVEFLSQDEWSRMVKAGEFVKRQEVSSVATAPVKLSISSMEQPIRAGTGFFVGMELKSMDGENSEICPTVMVEVDIPREFGKGNCYIENAKAENGKITWEITEGECFRENVLYCDFYPKPGEIVPDGGPSKTYFLNARATYGFSKWSKKDAKLAFGSWCCSDKDCEKIGKVCVPSKEGELKGTCRVAGAAPKPAEPEKVNVCCFQRESVSAMDADEDCKNEYNKKYSEYYSKGVSVFGDANFCYQKYNGQLAPAVGSGEWCVYGEGECKMNECDQSIRPPYSGWSSSLTCREIEV